MLRASALLTTCRPRELEKASGLLRLALLLGRLAAGENTGRSRCESEPDDDNDEDATWPPS
jgi:hypothetical protein